VTDEQANAFECQNFLITSQVCSQHFFCVFWQLLQYAYRK